MNLHISQWWFIQYIVAIPLLIIKEMIFKFLCLLLFVQLWTLRNWFLYNLKVVDDYSGFFSANCQHHIFVPTESQKLAFQLHLSWYFGFFMVPWFWGGGLLLVFFFYWWNCWPSLFKLSFHNILTLLIRIVAMNL